VSELPSWAIRPGLDVVDNGKRIRRARSVTVLGELPAPTLHHLRERGAQLTRVDTFGSAVTHLADRDFDATIVDLGAPGNGTAMVAD